ncbi:uncharacterized protein ASPGLDRAFT_65834 [Aspergillus glaucus CBS 516.65]|uniref:Maltose/galactoside acetyltransferase domain-containing protein n=1 Tax=Aspergillus glaucus CBS 516.65 TaxID=1160497 RepID=A0A1L9VM71_ASPGL|nr:hypothetical protein ASPGLDRAFT_65834 [Aspergillus glaucus CBS 516.65]OJJ85037.1 hypothetical protein ASPGLDRAFT_65834 [Aspergillus glaucus CBS 516.65]
MSTEKEKMLRGELYHAFIPDLIAARFRCKQACNRFNSIVQDTTPLPPPHEDSAEDEALLEDEPWIEGPIKIDYGFNVKLGANIYINAIALSPIPACLFSATHPLDPAVRNGTKGPEAGKEIHISEDCWLRGNGVVLSGVNIGKGATIGAGSVVTKGVPAFHVAVGNPARVIRKIETSMTE